MAEPDDYQLLREFARTHSEPAFTALVQRHIHLVHSVAWRQTSNAHAAEEITQAVFIILARKAGSLGGQISLAGWLHQTARLTAANYRRTEIRRAQREQEAFMQSQLDEVHPDPDAAWRQVAPLLDDALGQLRDLDRHALVLRFFEGKALAEVGVALGASEDAAKMRVNRALEKLRKIFTRRGVTLSATVIAGAVVTNSVQAAPVGLAKTISVVALAKGAAASGSTLTLVKGALKLMAWTKINTAVVVGASVLLAAGTATVAVKQIQKRNVDDSWRTPMPDEKKLNQVSPQVRIVPTKSTKLALGFWVRNDQKQMYGIGLPVQTIMEVAHDFRLSIRTVVSATLPRGSYDFIANLPAGNAEALQKQIKKQLGLVGRIEPRETDVLLLKVKHLHAPGLKPSVDRKPSRASKRGEINYAYAQPFHLASNLEYELRIPVIDQTELAGFFDFHLKWSQSDDQSVNRENLNQALLDQLGLELVPAPERIEMLIVEKVK